jgi:hypothetical protein
VRGGGGARWASTSPTAASDGFGSSAAMPLSGARSSGIARLVISRVCTPAASVLAMSGSTQPGRPPAVSASSSSCSCDVLAALAAGGAIPIRPIIPSSAACCGPAAAAGASSSRVASTSACRATAASTWRRATPLGVPASSSSARDAYGACGRSASLAVLACSTSMAPSRRSKRQTTCRSKACSASIALRTAPRTTRVSLNLSLAARASERGGAEAVRVRWEGGGGRCRRRGSGAGGGG